MKLELRAAPNEIIGQGAHVYVFEVKTESTDSWDGSTYFPTFQGDPKVRIPMKAFVRSYQLTDLYSGVTVKVQRSIDGVKWVDIATLSNNSYASTTGDNSPYIRFAVTLPSNASPPPAGTTVAVVAIAATR